MKNLDTVYVETTKDEWALQRTDSEGTVAKSEHGKMDDPKPWLAQNPEDRFFVVVWQVERVLRDIGQKSPFGNRAIVDLYQLAWILVEIGEIQDRKLETVAAWCGCTRKTESTEDRVSVIRECYERLVHRIEVGLKVEGVGREVVQELTARAASVLGRLAT